MKNKLTKASHDLEIGRVVFPSTKVKLYSTDNPYLLPSEKQEVEFWYQLPGDVMYLVFIITAVCLIRETPLPWEKILGVPLGVNVIVGLLNWYFYNKKIVYKLYATVLHNLFLYLIGFAATVFFFYKGVVILALISILAPFGFLAFAEPHLYLYSILAFRHRLHPKFLFFKREYGIKFPFDQG